MTRDELFDILMRSVCLGEVFSDYSDDTLELLEKESENDEEFQGLHDSYDVWEPFENRTAAELYGHMENLAISIRDTLIKEGIWQDT